MIYFRNSTEEQEVAIPKNGSATNIVTPTGGTYTAGQYIKISASNVISVTGLTPVTRTSQLTNDSGFLTQHQSLKTINNQSLIGSGNIEISGGTGVAYTAGTNIDITDHIISVTGITIPTKTSQLTNDSGFLTEHQSLSGKQDTLVSGTNIKTINNQSILGSGNIEISGGSGSYSAGTGIEISNNTIAVDQTYVATKASVALLEQIKEDNSNKVTAVTSSSTDVEYPSAKAVYDAISGGSGSYSAGTGIIISSNTISIDEDVVAKIDDVSEKLQQKQSIDYMVTAVTSSSTNEEYPSARAVYRAISGFTSYTAGTGIVISSGTISTQLKTINGTAIQGTGNIAVGTGISALTGGDSILISADNTVNIVRGPAIESIYSSIDDMGTVAYAARSLAQTVSGNTVCLSSTTETGCLKLWVDYLNTFMSNHYSDYNPPSITWR